MKASIIICTCNRAHALADCLDSVAVAIRNSGTDMDKTEIVLVNNNSTDETESVLKKWQESCGINTVYAFEANQGLSYARNCGIRAASGDLIIFTDDDCIMDQNFLINAMKHDTDDEAPVLRGGRVELGDKNDLNLTTKTSLEKREWHKSKNSARHENISEAILGASMIMKRRLIDTVGLFDTRLGAGSPIKAGEDTDYIYRSYLAGYRIKYEPDMSIHHFHGRKTPAEGFKLLANYCTGNGALYMKYLFREPNFCRAFYWDIRWMIKDMLLRKNTYLPDIGFSYAHKIFYNLKGAALFIRATIAP